MQLCPLLLIVMALVMGGHTVRGYCGDYLHTRHICCGSQLHPKPRFDGCCGHLPYGSNLEVCCNGQLRPIGTTDGCCGTMPYNTLLAVCCRGVLYPRGRGVPAGCVPDLNTLP